MPEEFTILNQEKKNVKQAWRSPSSAQRAHGNVQPVVVRRTLGRCCVLKIWSVDEAESQMDQSFRGRGK